MTHIEWQFGGWLRAWPAAGAAGLLALLAGMGIIYVIWFYRRTAGELAPPQRRLLGGLRATMVLLLLLCLANPMRVQETPPQKNPEHTLAVLVDRSASMCTPDYRGDTRLASALRLWQQVEPVAKQNFTGISYHRFANTRQTATSLQDAITAGPAGNETHLFSALEQTLAENPTAIVCLTDGLDTTADDAGKFAAEAVQRGVPIYFVPGKNHLTPGASLALCEVQAPARVLRQSQFTASALIETAVAQDGELPVELWVNGQKRAAARLPVRAGRNALSWPVAVDSGEPGALSLEFRAGEESAACVSEVVENTTMEVLYYQGALQWGYRFLRGALESDPSFRLTAILNPALQVQLSTGSGSGPTPMDLPEDVAELRRFQVVILAHVFADQLTPKQQAALLDYVRGGGGVLFISPDAEATERFSGTALEQMLPVIFEKRHAAGDLNLQKMRQQLSDNAAQSGDDLYAGGAQALTLKPFALPPGARGQSANRLFAGTNADQLPKFSENARVRATKPGAETLAVSGQQKADVLLARQQYGNGFAAALTTDLLWRWKMSLPSDSHAVEQFWQQLLLSLAPGSGRGLRVMKLTASPSIRAPAVFSVNAPTEAPPLLEAISPGGEHQRLTVAAAPDTDGTWEGSFAPTTTGRWEVQATDASGHKARVVFPVKEKSSSAEMLNLPADLAGMRLLAESTGGALVDNTTVFQLPMEAAPKPVAKLPEPLWNSGALLLLLLGIYATELIVRRRFKLL